MKFQRVLYLTFQMDKHIDTYVKGVFKQNVVFKHTFEMYSLFV